MVMPYLEGESLRHRLERVDLDARLIERWRQGDIRPEIVEDKLDWALSIGTSGQIVVPALFAITR